MSMLQCASTPSSDLMKFAPLCSTKIIQFRLWPVHNERVRVHEENMPRLFVVPMNVHVARALGLSRR